MKAITLRHPWPWAICCCGKRIENRMWTPALRVGEKFAIHGGRWPIGADNIAHGAADAEYVEEIRDTIVSLGDANLLPDGEVTFRILSRYAGIVAVATYGGSVSESDSPWFCGPIGWVIADLIVLPQPVPCRGARKLWDVPSDVLGRMRAQFSSTLSAG